MLSLDLASIARTILVGVLAYIALVLLLRTSGKRTLSKWNAFDLIVTIALGSSLATALLSRGTSFFQGVAAFVVLIALQFAVTWLAVRSRRFERWIKAQPRALVFEGRILADALREERVTLEELRAALRGQGVSAVEEVDAVVLETDGTFSVIRQMKGARSALAHVAGVPSSAGQHGET